MCNVDCVLFAAKHLSPREVRGKKVIEVGSLDINGSLRPMIESWQPAKYIGIDLQKGPGVDQICRAEEMLRVFGKERFDLVLSTELLEHVRDWRKVIANFKNVCRPRGIILVTTRSQGRTYHGFPDDFWRYELKDMKHIFADCQILALAKDPREPGVFVKVKKPKKFIEKDLSGFQLYSVVTGKRVSKIEDKDLQSRFFTRLAFKEGLKDFISRKPRLRRFLEKISSLVQH